MTDESSGCRVAEAAQLSHFAASSGLMFLTCKFSPLPPASFLDSLIRPLFQKRIARVPRFLVRIVAGSVVAADEGPARIGTSVLIRPVQQVAMKEDCRAGLQLAVDQLEAFQGGLDPFQVRTGLIADLAVVDA